MQWRLPALLSSRSLNTCPRCAPQFLQRISVRCIPSLLSSHSSICSRFTGSVKLGQPAPESNFVSDEKSSAPQTAQWYMPFAFSCRYLPLPGVSVPPSRATRRRSGDSSSSFFIITIYLGSCPAVFYLRQQIEYLKEE